MPLTYRVAQSDYSSRVDALQCISSAQELLVKYVDISPHSLLHAGFLCDAIKDLELSEGSTVLELGMDPLKDYLIATICGVSIECYDIESDSVEAGNALMRRIFGSNPPVKYVFGDFLQHEIVQKTYSLALLSQMDYVLNNRYLKSFSARLSQDSVDCILIASPSSYRWFSLSLSNIAYNFELILRTISKMVASINVRGELSWHIRSVGEIRRLFGNEYSLSKISSYRQPYAITNLLVMRRNNRSHD